MPIRDCPRSSWIAANAIGVAVFLVSASQFWIEPEVADIPGASGGAAFGWIVWAAPIPVIFILINVGWCGMSLRRGVREGWVTGAITALLLAAWAAAVLFDNAHHGI